MNGDRPAINRNNNPWDLYTLLYVVSLMFPYSVLNPNKTLCPYELNGQCEDKHCTYRHLLQVTKQPNQIKR